MSDEAIEAQAIEVAKEIISQGGGAAIRFGTVASKTVARALMASGGAVVRKHREHRDSGEMKIKRLYKVSDGNLQQIDLNERSVEQVLAQLREHGVDFAVERTDSGKISLWFAGKDLDHVTHIVDDAIERLGLLNEDQVADAHLPRVDDPEPVTMELPAVRAEPAPDTEEMPAVQTRDAIDDARRDPASDNWRPNREEAVYLDAAGFKERDTRDEPDHDRRHNPEPERNPASDAWRPDQEEAVYLAAAGFRERDEPERATERERADKEEPSQRREATSSRPTPMDENQRRNERDAIDEAEERREEKEPERSVQRTETGDYGFDPDDDAARDEPNAGTHRVEETVTERKRPGKTGKKPSIKQRLRSEISKRVQQRQATATGERVRERVAERSRPRRK